MSLNNLKESYEKSKKKVLVVDDSMVNILKAEHILKEYGFDSLTATSGMAALKCLKLNKVDLILLDIEMPEMNGFETLELIHKIPQWKKIPVIFVTSDNTEEFVIEAVKKGAAGYVTKPFNEEELLKHVRKVFTNS